MSDGFFVAELPAGVGPGDAIRLTGSEAHHAAVVRRVRLGEIVTVTDGRGRGIVGPVITAKPDEVVITVQEWLHQSGQRPLITVVQALPKKDRADLAVDLMTEVGVDRIVPWQADRSIVQWSSDKAEAGRTKWQAVARETSKQARRLRFPQVDPVVTTAEVVDLIRTIPASLIMHEQEFVPLATYDFGRVEQCLIVIGPEGGLTEAEVEVFQRAGGQTYSLGRTVLRTSIAGAIAIAQVRTLWLAGQPREPR